MVSSNRWIERNVLYVVSFLDLFAVALIIPSLASYVKSLDGGVVMYGYIMSLYGFLQLFAAPIVGNMSDIYGRRQVLLVCLIGAAFGYTILGLSWNIYIVLLSRIPCAIFKHTLDLIKIAVTDAEKQSDRSAIIGRLNAASSAGFILGPAIGGYLSGFPQGFNFTSIITSSIFLFNFILISTFYHEHSVLTINQEKHKQDENVKTAMINWKRLLIESKNRFMEMTKIRNEEGPARNLLLARFLLALAAIVYRTHFVTLLEDRFNADSRTRGYILSYMGALGLLGGVSVGGVTKLMKSELLVLKGASLVYVFSFVALSLATSLTQVCILLIPQVISISIIRASSIALQTSFVSQEHIGAFMGLSSSLTSFARTIAPIFSGWSYVIAMDGPAHAAAGIASISVAIFFKFPSNAVKLGANTIVSKMNIE